MKIPVLTGVIRKILYTWIIKSFFNKGTILDVAAGEGEFMDVCKLLNKKVSGIDINPQRKEIIKYDITKKGFVKKYKKFENLFCSQIIEHFNNDELISFINEVCKKRVAIITPIENKKFWYRKGVPEYKTKYGHKRPYSLMELDYKMKKINLKPIFRFKGFGNIIWIGQKV